MRRVPRSPVADVCGDARRHSRAGASPAIAMPHAAEQPLHLRPRKPERRDSDRISHADAPSNPEISCDAHAEPFRQRIRRRQHIFDGDSKHRRRVSRSPLVADLLRPRLVHNRCAGHKRTVARRIGGTVQAHHRSAQRRRQMQRTGIRRDHASRMCQQSHQFLDRRCDRQRAAPERPRAALPPR